MKPGYSSQFESGSPRVPRIGAGVQTVLAACLLATAGMGSTLAATYDVDVSSPRYTLYTDPYNGNEIKVGGFSGLYPAVGKSDRFYVITDRGPAPDFVDANGQAYKAWAIPDFGPHLLTVYPNGFVRGFSCVSAIEKPVGHASRFSPAQHELPSLRRVSVPLEYPPRVRAV